MSKDPLVSICCIAYNHEKFIDQCIEGFLIQKTNFPFEIIIHDDASTDNTALIIKTYEEKYPDLIVTIIQSQNQYSRKPGSILFNFMLPRVRGKYVAFCEGDDYWIDPLKLQKQVDFLESNPDHGLIYTNSLILYDETGEKKIKGSFQYLSFEHLLTASSSQIATLTVMLRYQLLLKYKNEIIPENQKWLMVDYPIWLYISKYSKLKYLDEVTAVYRYLNESASHFLSPHKTFAFISSGFEVKKFFVNKFDLDGNIHNILLNNYYKYSIFYAIQIKEKMLIKNCIKFLKRNKMGVEFIGVSLMLLMHKFNLPINFTRKVLFHVWRKRKPITTILFF